MIVNRLDALDARLTASEASASESRGRMHQKLERQGELLLTIDGRVTAVEKAVACAQPTLREYAETKLKVATAGMLGRGLWRVGRWLLGGAVALYALRHDIAAWWQWFMHR